MIVNIVNTTRLIALILLAIEMFITAHFFFFVSGKKPQLRIFKVKGVMFALFGVQYLIGIVLIYLRSARIDSNLLEIFTGISLLFSIPLIWSIRRYRKGFVEGDVTVRSNHVPPGIREDNKK